jgi:ferritin
MVSEKMLEELNKQINEEIFSQYIYMAMAADLFDKNLKGMAHWMWIQAHEEQTHATIFYNYIIERRRKVELEAVGKPPVTWASPLAIFEAAHEHEVHITGRINYLLGLAREENDNATYNMLQWFVQEQIEEEANTDEVSQQLKIVGNDGRGILMLDRELAARAFVPPTNPYYVPFYAVQAAGAAVP